MTWWTYLFKIIVIFLLWMFESIKCLCKKQQTESKRIDKHTVQIKLSDGWQKHLMRKDSSGVLYLIRRCKKLYQNLLCDKTVKVFTIQIYCKTNERPELREKRSVQEWCYQNHRTILIVHHNFRQHKVFLKV